MPAYTNEITLARTQLNALVRDIEPLRRKHQDGGATVAYFNESTTLHHKLVDWMNSLEPSLSSTEFASPQLITLQ